MVDVDHLGAIRRRAAEFTRGGLRHLVLEVVAYAADEADATGGGRCVVTHHADGSVSVSDNGRGTAVRVGEDGEVVRKPVMSTRDLRFFDSPNSPLLPDGLPRRGISVVSALSEWLVHTNHRGEEGSWTQRYEYGIPVSDLTPVAGTETRPRTGTGTGTGTGTQTWPRTGTTVRFSVAQVLRRSEVDIAIMRNAWPALEIEVVNE